MPAPRQPFISSPASDGQGWVVHWLLGLLVLLAGSGMVLGSEEEDSATATTVEYQLKAGFLFNFAKLVTWPTNVFAPEEPLRIGVWDKGEAQKILVAELAKKRVGDRTIEVIRCRKREDMHGCAMFFITRGQAELARELLKSASGRPVLTIGEFDRFGARGGCINFIRKGDNIRFEINPGAIERAGLKISSKVSAMAVIVQTQEAEP